MHLLQNAGRAVAKQAGGLDAQLFVIQHLLFLREQIAQFDVDLTVTDIDLDFTHMRDHVRRIMTGMWEGDSTLLLACVLTQAATRCNQS